LKTTPAERFEIDYVQVLDYDGNTIDGSLSPKFDKKILVESYKLMRFLRAFDDKALSLQRQGRMGTYSEFKGQEAIQVGIALSLEKRDWFFPTYRDSAALIARGVPPEQIMLYWSGDERGQEFPAGVNAFPIAIPVASQIPHAVGGAWALKYRNEDAVTLVTVGDGGTSKADFYESLNLAGDFRLPVVCVIENNEYAISLPREQQTASKTLAQKALAMGMEGVQVDGNDLLAVSAILKRAVEKARRGDGPTLVECLTYRLGHHTTATGDEPYRDEEEIQKWKHKDPIERLRKYLERSGVWSEALEESLEIETKERINDAVRKFEAVEKPRPESMFRYTYAEEPLKLREEEKDLLSNLNQKDAPS
jgi:pyruvate dehydrogenase E1 component alpha subunit